MFLGDCTTINNICFKYRYLFLYIMISFDIEKIVATFCLLFHETVVSLNLEIQNNQRFSMCKYNCNLPCKTSVIRLTKKKVVP